MQVIERLVLEAEGLEEANNNVGALARWRDALAIQRSPAILARMGRLCTVMGHLQEAESLLLEAISRAPSLSDAYFYLGFNYKKRDLLDLSKQYIEQGLTLEEWAPGLAVLGEIHRRQNDVEAARRAFERSLSLDPSNAEAWYGLGDTYTFVDDLKAIELFARATLEDPSHVAAHRERGHMLWRNGELEAAEQSIRAALGLNEDDPWAHDYLGHIFSSSGQTEDAKREFLRAVNLRTDVPIFHCNLGDALAQLGDFSAAEAEYIAALALDVNNYLSNLRYGQLLAERGYLKKSAMYLKRALESKPDDRRARQALERVLAMSGESS
jgi:tetratricopeptide (TPR) repeat protein